MYPNDSERHPTVNALAAWSAIAALVVFAAAIVTTRIDPNAPSAFWIVTAYGTAIAIPILAIWWRRAVRSPQFVPAPKSAEGRRYSWIFVGTLIAVAAVAFFVYAATHDYYREIAAGVGLGAPALFAASRQFYASIAPKRAMKDFRRQLFVAPLLVLGLLSMSVKPLFFAHTIRTGDEIAMAGSVGLLSVSSGMLLFAILALARRTTRL